MGLHTPIKNMGYEDLAWKTLFHLKHAWKGI